MSLDKANTLETVQAAAATAMDKAVLAFEKQIEKLHTGRASPALLENIHISQPHGGNSLLSHIARISVMDAQTLMVTPWDKSLLPAIQKAILQFEMGLNPAIQGDALRVPLPPLSDKRRKDMVRMVHQLTEAICEEIRSHRRQANTRAKVFLKDKLINEDEYHRTQHKVQNLTDDHIKQVRAIAKEKEEQILYG